MELFFKWIKEHLRIHAFYGTSENAGKTQIRIAIPAYVLGALAGERLAPQATRYTFLQVLRLSLFEKTPILRAFEETDSQCSRTSVIGVIDVLYHLASWNSVIVFPNRSLTPITPDCRGFVAKNVSGNRYTGPFLNFVPAYPRLVIGILRR